MNKNRFSLRVSLAIPLFIFISIFGLKSINAQTVSPCDASPFCSDESYNFPNETSSVTIPPGVTRGCLGSAPRPIWYYMKIGTAGDLILRLEQRTAAGLGIDVDFAMYGPYTSLEEGCLEVEAGDPPLQCSYSGFPTETLGIGAPGGAGTGASTPPDAEVGEVYIVLITNYNGAAGFITFEQVGGEGRADCGILCGLEAENTGNVCLGGQVYLSSTISDTENEFRYFWFDETGALVDTMPNTAVTPTGPGDYIYRVIAVSPTDDSCFAETNFTVYPIMNKSVDSDTLITLCNVSEHTYNLTTPVEGFNYQWLKDGEIIPGATNTSITVYESGKYRIVGVSQFGCVDTSLTYEIIFNFVEAKWSHLLNPGCTEDEVVFTNESINANLYTWDFDDGSPVSDVTDPVHVYENQGNYFVRLIASGNNQCSDTLKREIVINHPIIAKYNQDVDTICQQDAIGFHNTSVGDLVAYQWLINDELKGTERHFSYVFTKAGNNSVALIVEDRIGCKDTFMTSVFVDSIGFVEISADRFEICAGEAIKFDVAFLETAHDIIWEFGDGTRLTGRDASLSHSYETPGNYQVVVETTHLKCSNSSNSIEIKVKEIPVVNLGNDTMICLQGAPFIIRPENNTSLEGSTALWNTGETTMELTVVHPGVYTLMVDKDGCINTDEISVVKDCYVDIPNSFTPNGDGNNDYFFPRQLLSKGIVSFNMQIYNRWGQLIFETNSTNGRGWDGKMNDKIQPVGTYIYSIKVVYDNNVADSYNGNINLLR